MRGADADLKSQQIALAHGPLRDHGIDQRAAGFLVVDGVMLDVADDMLCLLAGHQFSHERTREHGVLA